MILHVINNANPIKAMTNIIREYDSNRKLIHAKYSNGYEMWYEYDSNGNRIHFKESDGFEAWWEHDSNGKCIHFKNSDGVEKHYD